MFLILNQHEEVFAGYSFLDWVSKDDLKKEKSVGVYVCPTVKSGEIVCKDIRRWYDKHSPGNKYSFSVIPFEEFFKIV